MNVAQNTVLAGKKNRLINALWQHIWSAGFVILVGVAVLFSTTRWAALADLAVLDSQHKLLSTFLTKPVANEVVVVGIDEETLKRYSEPLALWHPYFAQFLEAMAVAKPTVVGIDVVLPDHSYGSLVPGYDKRLLEGLVAARKSTQIVLGLTVDEAGRPRAIYPPFVSVAGSDALGYVLLQHDQDNVVRRASEQIGEDGRAVPTLVGQMVRKMGMVPNSGLIDYSLGAQQAYIPLQQVVQWMAEGNEIKLKEIFSNRAVLLGSVLKYEDRFIQPTNLAGWERDNV